MAQTYGVVTDTNNVLKGQSTNVFQANSNLLQAAQIKPLTNFANSSGTVKTTAKPNQVYNDTIKSLADWYADDGFLSASVGYNANDGTSTYGQFSLFGTAINAYGNLCGWHVWNTNLNGGLVASDRRAHVVRMKDPAGTNTANWTDKGNYVLWENRLSLAAVDRGNSPYTLVYANYLMCDEFGNVGLGDLGQRSDDPAQNMLHPWGKTTFYPSYKFKTGTPTIPLIGLFPSTLISPPLTNSMEYEGNYIYLTDINLRRWRMLMADTNGVVSNFQATAGASLPTAVLGGANTSANMAWREATLLLTNSSSSGQVEWVIVINDKNMGGLRVDQVGNFNLHSTNFIFWNSTTTVAHAVSIVSGNLNVGGAAGVAAKERLAVAGNTLVTNGFIRLWVGVSPTFSNYQAQVYCKTNAATGANELFAMNDAGNETILTGTVTNQISANAALDFPSTLAQTNSDLTITATGAADGDPVVLGVPNAAIVGGTCYNAWVSSANTVTVRFNNYTTGAKDPASATFKVLVKKLK